MADSPFNEDSKNIIFSREALISGEERPENLGKMEGEYQSLSPGTKILLMLKLPTVCLLDFGRVLFQ